MNKKRVALALAAALGINTLMVTVGQVGGQLTVAHAQNARLTNPEDIKKIGSFSFKTLETTVEAGANNNEVVVKFNNINASDILNVDKVTFTGKQFTEREKLDKAASATGEWRDGALRVSGLTEPGIYTGEVTITLKDGTGQKTEKYTLSLVKKTSDTLSYNVDVEEGTIVINNLKINNGTSDLTVDPTNVSLTTSTGQVIPMSKNGGTYTFSLLGIGLVTGDKLTFEVKYGEGNEYSLTSQIALVKDLTPSARKVAVTNSTTEMGKLAAQVQTDFALAAEPQVSPVNHTLNSTQTYGIKADGKDLVSYTQTVGSTSDALGGASLTINNINDTKLNVTVAAADVDTSKVNFVPHVTLSYGNVSAGLIGDYSFVVDGDMVTNLYSTQNLNPSIADSNNNKVITFNPQLTPGITPVATPFEVNLGSNLKHGYDSVGVTFGVDESKDLEKINLINQKLSGMADPVGGKKVPATINSQKTYKTPVKTSIIVAADTLDGVSVQVKFEKKDNKTGRITLVNGKDLLTKLDIKDPTTALNLTVGNVRAGYIAPNTTGEPVFEVIFADKLPTGVVDWTLNFGGRNPLNGKIDFSGNSIESVNLTKVEGTNSGAEGSSTEFRIDATFGNSVPAIGKIEVDRTGNVLSDDDRVSFNDLSAKNDHVISKNVTSGKYRGVYSAGVWVTTQPIGLKITDIKSNTAGRVDLTIDGTFFAKDDYKKVKNPRILYRETVAANETPKAWTDAKVSFTTGENSDISTDAQDNKTITKSVTGLTPDKEYEFQVIYDYEVSTSNVVSVPSNIRTQKVSNNVNGNNSTITGSGSTTTGTSTGSTTINVTTNNSTLTGTSASVTLPTSFRYDSSKTPVAVTFKYKDKDGKVVTETKEQFSNVTAKFNGDKVEVNGLVPGKNYDEITVDYTDNNGRTRSIILRNIQTSTTVESEKYLANVYEVVLSRPADEAGYHFHLDNLKNKKVSLREFLLNMLSEKEFIEKYKSTEEKIEGLYNAIVARSSDEAGKKFWVDEYKKVLAVYGSETTALKAIADRMVNENELKELADKMGVQW